MKIDSIEYRNAWIKNVVGQSLNPEERAVLSGANYVIPTLIAEEVWDKLVASSDLLMKVDVTRFASYIKYPLTTTNNAATAQAVGGSVSPSADVIDSMELLPVEYVKTLAVTADIDGTSLDAIGKWLVDGLVAKISEEINKDILIGTGTNELTGIAESVDADDTPLPSNDSFFTWATFINIIKSLPLNYQKGAVWIMTPKMFFENVLGISAESNFVHYVQYDNEFNYRLIGHDVILMPEAEIDSKENIFFGDPKAYKVNFFSDIIVKPFETPNTTTNTWRGATLVNGKLLDTSAFVRFAQT